MSASMRAVLFAAAVSQAFAGHCCYAKWGDSSTCGKYPAGGKGPICGTDGVTVCKTAADCTGKPTPAPPSPVPTPTPPPPVPTPTPPPTPALPGMLPNKTIGLYLLIADDAWPYKSETKWVPKLPDYMGAGGVNVLFLAFVHPAKMPALPPAMQYIGQHRPVGTQRVIASIGGQSYSDSASWPWLDSAEAAEAMAAEVAQWKTKYGIDGVDLDAEGNQNGPNLKVFAEKLKKLDPTFIVTQPVFGYPQVNCENYMVNQCFAKGTRSAVDAIGIMVYEGTGALQYLSNYLDGNPNRPITVNVPSKQILLGAGGQSKISTIEKLAQAAHDQDLGGIMVWFASVNDTATGKVGNQYSHGAMDSSIQSSATQATWKKALDIMNGNAVDLIV